MERYEWFEAIEKHIVMLENRIEELEKKVEVAESPGDTVDSSFIFTRST